MNLNAISVIVWAAVSAALVPEAALAWQPKKAPLMTSFAAEVDPAHPLPE